MKRVGQRKCRHCGAWFRPDPRNARHQRYCSEPACRRASKAVSQRQWLAKPENQDYFHGAEHVARVRHWAGAPSIRATGAERSRSPRSLGMRYKRTAARKPLPHKARGPIREALRYKKSYRRNRPS
ncbi:hypothetical protein OKW27_000004 [Paraburkholderia sp. 35.1]